MGGRGAMMNPAANRVPEYKTVDFIAGSKVLERKDKTKQPNLPIMSHTPGTSYILKTKGKDGDLQQYRKYGYDRNPAVDIDFDKPHSGIRPHIHDWKDGKRGEGRALTKKERKKYREILEAVHGKK